MRVFGLRGVRRQARASIEFAALDPTRPRTDATLERMDTPDQPNSATPAPDEARDDSSRLATVGEPGAQTPDATAGDTEAAPESSAPSLERELDALLTDMQDKVEKVQALAEEDLAAQLDSPATTPIDASPAASPSPSPTTGPTPTPVPAGASAAVPTTISDLDDQLARLTEDLLGIDAAASAPDQASPAANAAADSPSEPSSASNTPSPSDAGSPAEGSSPANAAGAEPVSGASEGASSVGASSIGASAALAATAVANAATPASQAADAKQPAAGSAPARPRAAAGASAIKLLGALLLPLGGIARASAAPLAKRPRMVRDTIGWVGLNTLFLAAVVWIYHTQFQVIEQPSAKSAPRALSGSESPSHGAAAADPHATDTHAGDAHASTTHASTTHEAGDAHEGDHAAGHASTPRRRPTYALSEVMAERLAAEAAKKGGKPAPKKDAAKDSKADSKKDAGAHH